MATITMASSRLGNTSMMSISRMIAVSTRPPANAAVRPSTIPQDSDSVTTAMPISSDSRAP